MIYLIDTNSLSEPARPAPNLRIVRRLQRHEREIATAAPVWHELNFGCQRLPHSRQRQRIEAYLFDLIQKAIPILRYDRIAAEWHAEERARLVKSGKTPPFIDGQIAAIAVVNDLTLVTQNTRDFRSFRKLRVVDWSK